MDAMDITSLPTPQPERENRIVKDEYIDEAIDSVSNENVDVSFEDLMCSMFDEVMQKKEAPVDKVLNDLDVKDEILLNGEINVDEDVDSLIENQGKNISTKDTKSKEQFIPLIDEDFVVEEEIPVIECELEVSSPMIKDKRETKNVKEEPIEEDEKKEEKDTSILSRDEHKNVVLSIKENVESSKKVESKEEKKEEAQDIAESVVAQRPKKHVKKLNISVEDLRTAPEVQTGEVAISTEEAQMGNFDGESSFSDGKSVSSSQTSTSSSQKAEGSENVNSNQFSSILAEQIKANSAELVQRGKIVLRDGNVGEIRLQLKPAHLGVVRINLKMTQDKKMKGEVTVSSQEAYEAFEDSMSELVSSFKDAGFDTAGFDLNWKDGKQEVVREDLSDKYFSPEKTLLSLREKLNFTENIYQFGQAENVNVLA